MNENAIELDLDIDADELELDIDTQTLAYEVRLGRIAHRVRTLGAAQSITAIVHDAEIWRIDQLPNGTETETQVC